MPKELFDVTDVRCLDGHLLRLRFDDGVEGLFDMEPWFGRKPYRDLRNSALFNAVRVECGTVVWPGEIDMDPETLRNQLKPIGTPAAASAPNPTTESPVLYAAESAPTPYKA